MSRLPAQNPPLGALVFCSKIIVAIKLRLGALINPNMTTKFRHLLSIGLILSFGAARTASAQEQEYFRVLESPSQIAPVVQIQPEDENKYNLAVGPVRFNVAAGVGLEFNDNITYSDTDRESDIIFRPSLNLDATWRLTDLNTLHFSLGISYAKYFDHSQYDTDGLLISPNSELAFSVHISDIIITVRDRISYQEDPYTFALLSNVATYQRWQNLVGVNLQWAINPSVDISAGYEHYNLWTNQQEFRQLQNSIDTVYLRPSVKITPAFTLGLNGSVNWVNYSADIQNNGVGYLVGAFVNLQLTDNTSAYLEGGYQLLDFDDNGTIGDTSNSNSWYMKSTIQNQLSDVLSHHLGFTKTAELGFGTNFYTLYHAEYGATWKVMPDLVLSPALFYEHYKTSGQNAESANRFGAAVGVRYILTPSVTLAADYRFLMQDANVNNADYYQNSVLLSLFYNF